LIDPVTGRPSSSVLTFATVITGHAWRAEVFAKMLVLRGTPACFDDVEAAGAAALAIDDDGHVSISRAMGAFVAEPPPSALARAS
jgi:thiamine biosynthesis lipoprotein ApbE